MRFPLQISFLPISINQCCHRKFHNKIQSFTNFFSQEKKKVDIFTTIKTTTPWHLIFQMGAAKWDENIPQGCAGARENWGQLSGIRKHIPEFLFTSRVVREAVGVSQMKIKLKIQGYRPKILLIDNLY